MAHLVEPAASADEPRLVDALRSGDEAAFVSLFERFHPALVRLARIYVPSHAVAQEAAQEAWLGVWEGIERFEGRSSLKTWIFRILINRAKTRGQREARSVSFSALSTPEDEPDEPAVDPERFLPSDHAQWPHHWASFPNRWDETPEARLLSRETFDRLQGAIEALPPAQREVITLRDVEGWTSEEVCNVLGVGETNQRILLHRARSKVRRALERYLDEAGLSRPTKG